jgi:glycosyltransferase involved in cell wall biosynthesis
MNDPRVSVIVPCRNYGRFLAEALDSVLGQSIRDVEILLFNDGSTDETDGVARRYARDGRVTYIPQRRRGLAVTRNAGLRLARGRYVQFLDADDALHPDKLARQVTVLEADPTLAATYCPHLAIDAAGRQISDPIPWRPISTEAPAHDLLVQWERDLHIPPVCFLFRRAALEGLSFDESLPTHEEWDLYLRLAARGGRLHATSEPLASYRLHAGSLSTDAPRMSIGRRRVLEKVARWDGLLGQAAGRCLP